MYQVPNIERCHSIARGEMTGSNFSLDWKAIDWYYTLSRYSGVPMVTRLQLETRFWAQIT